MGSLLTMIWYLLAGFLMGWVASTLVEWLWFRQQRMPARGEDVEQLAGEDGPSPVKTTEADAAPVEPKIKQTQAAAPAPLASGSPGSFRSVPVSSSPPATADRTQRPDQKPPQPQAERPMQNYPDKLSAIRGIGPVYESRLYEAGIFTWHQLSQSDPGTLRAVTRAQPSSNPADWIAQAREMAAASGRAGAVYTGAMPDPLTTIDGIGPVYEKELYQNGIYTFDQLAAATPEQIAQVLAHVAPVDGTANYTGWIEQAGRLRRI